MARIYPGSYQSQYIYSKNLEQSQQATYYKLVHLFATYTMELHVIIYSFANKQKY